MFVNIVESGMNAFLEPGTCFLEPGTHFLEPGTRFQEPRTSFRKMGYGNTCPRIENAFLRTGNVMIRMDIMNVIIWPENPRYNGTFDDVILLDAEVAIACSSSAKYHPLTETTNHLCLVCHT